MTTTARKTTHTVTVGSKVHTRKSFQDYTHVVLVKQAKGEAEWEACYAAQGSRAYPSGAVQGAHGSYVPVRWSASAENAWKEANRWARLGWVSTVVEVGATVAGR